jgi:hypothetical protein
LCSSSSHSQARSCSDNFCVFAAFGGILPTREPFPNGIARQTIPQQMMKQVAKSLGSACPCATSTLHQHLILSLPLASASRLLHHRIAFLDESCLMICITSISRDHALSGLLDQPRVSWQAGCASRSGCSNRSLLPLTAFCTGTQRLLP